MASRIPLDEFSKLDSLIELSSEALGGSITAVSDEFFAAAENLLKVGPAVSMKGQFGPNGALFDGWESRRHNKGYDWVIIKLGSPGTVSGFDIDTSNFNGNESPASGVWGAFVEEGTIAEDSPAWTPLLPVSPLGPSSRHLFSLAAPSAPVTHVKLTMHPDGGIGRFRVYGDVVPQHSTGTDIVDLASVLGGARVVAESDQHFGRGANLILPGRGKDMGDGWETKRSRNRGPGQGDWVIIKLGRPGFLEYVDLDTLHFVGNFPQSADVQAIHSAETIPDAADPAWTSVLETVHPGPHRHHFFQLSHRGTPFTHVKVNIYPDGGLKRVRVYGAPADSPYRATVSVPPVGETTTVVEAGGAAAAAGSYEVPLLHALPLTARGFAPYGDVLQSYPDHRVAPKEIVIDRANFDTADKYNKLSEVAWAAPAGWGKPQPALNFSVFRCDPQEKYVFDGTREKLQWQVKALERHPHTTQTFSPLGYGGRRFLVVVALNGPDDRPDPATIRAFMATSQQAITYGVGTWHHPLVALDAPTDFACIQYQTGVPELDCELLHFERVQAVVEEAPELLEA